jgi:hypothetical protein
MMGTLWQKSMVLECVKEFARSVQEVFQEEFLRPPPNATEMNRILHENEARGFPSMLGSIDCMHWEWQSCSTGWQGQYLGHKGSPTVILEAGTSKDLRIWHVFLECRAPTMI